MTAVKPISVKLSEAEAAKFLALSPRTLKSWRSLKRGPAFLKLGSRCVYDLGDLQAWSEAQRRPSTGRGRPSLI